MVAMVLGVGAAAAWWPARRAARLDPITSFRYSFARPGQDQFDLKGNLILDVQFERIDAKMPASGGRDISAILSTWSALVIISRNTSD